MDHDGNEAMDQLTAHIDRGWDLVQRGDLAGALVSAEKSLEVDEDSPDAHNLLGYVYQAQGRADEALEQYRTALDLDEGYVDAMLNAADVLLHPMHDHEEALRLIDDAMEWLSEDEPEALADALLLKVDAYLSMGDREAARRAVAQLPQGPFETPELAFSVGRARFDVGDLDGAEPLIRAAAEQRPKSADVVYYLALVNEARGDRRSALLGFLETRELDQAAGAFPWSMPHEQFERKVEAALGKLDQTVLAMLDGALVVVTDLPGPEVVADGVDPRAALLLDDASPDAQPPRVGRVFVYQRNVERVATSVLEIEDEIARALQHELAAAFSPVQK